MCLIALALFIIGVGFSIIFGPFGYAALYIIYGAVFSVVGAVFLMLTLYTADKAVKMGIEPDSDTLSNIFCYAAHLIAASLITAVAGILDNLHVMFAAFFMGLGLVVILAFAFFYIAYILYSKEE